MTTSTITASFSCDISLLWDTVTSLCNYSWRSDIKRIEIIEPNKKFIEYSNDDFPTTFTITILEPLKRYEFDIENKNMTGHWIGLFEYDSVNAMTSITFTEQIEIKKLFMKPFIKGYLKKQQQTYVEDLQRSLK